MLHYLYVYVDFDMSVFFNAKNSQSQRPKGMASFPYFEQYVYVFLNKIFHIFFKIRYFIDFP